MLSLKAKCNAEGNYYQGFLLYKLLTKTSARVVVCKVIVLLSDA